jgi:GNAT superfamily N-acetyltransferase
MEVVQIFSNKKQFLELLLLADEQESMIDRYLEAGDLFALYDGDLRSVCVVLKVNDGIYEIKNIATYEEFQGMGYGKYLIRFIFEHYRDECNTMFVGTGDIPSITKFYEKCGFNYSHKIKNFFVDNYDHLMFESGIQLIDMVYFKKELR